jgi:hypothetical protein
MTYFGVWVKMNGVWKHLVTMNYPYSRARFNWGATSFLENYGGINTAAFRQMRTRNGWKRYEDGKWIAFTGGSFDVGTIGGTSSDYFYMATKDGLPSNINSQNSYQTVPSPGTTNPSIAKINALSYTAFYNQLTAILTVEWTIDPASCPQLGYTIKVYPVASNTPLMTKSDMQSHIRKATISLKDIVLGSYTVELQLSDVIDNKSILYKSTVTVSTTLSPTQIPTRTPSIPTISPTFKPSLQPTLSTCKYYRILNFVNIAHCEIIYNI